MDITEMKRRVRTIAQNYDLAARFTETEISLCAKDTDDDWCKWVRYDIARDRIVYSDTDTANIWLCDTKPLLDADGAIELVRAINWAFDAHLMVRQLIDPEDWQEIAKVPDASEDARYTEWFNTDDLQRCRYLGYHRWHLIEANYADGKYLLSEDMVVDMTPGGEWIKEDGSMTDRMQSIFESYYSNPDDFDYTDPETREQIMAEMVYEQTSMLFNAEGYGLFDDSLFSDDQIEDVPAGESTRI